jgi:hypothetical protein
VKKSVDNSKLLHNQVGFGGMKIESRSRIVLYLSIWLLMLVSFSAKLLLQGGYFYAELFFSRAYAEVMCKS